MATLTTINPAAIDLEIQQYLVQSGVDRDTGAHHIGLWLQLLESQKHISGSDVTIVANNNKQFQVQFLWQSKRISKIYDVSNTERTASAQTTPASAHPAVKKQGRVAHTAQRPKPQKQPKKESAEEAFDRAMRGI